MNKDITLTATSSYTGTYQWYSGSTAINGATKKSYVATKGTNTEGKVTYKVKMKSEKRTPEATYVAAIDKKAPAISITSKIATKDNLTISLSETSSGSRLKGYAITSSATTPITWTAISGTSYLNTFSKATGTYYIHVKDAAGNTTYKTVSITSMDPPTCSISLSGTMGTNSWYKTNVGVSMATSGTVSSKGLATTANSTNGVSSVTHSTDTSGVTYYGYVSNVAGSYSCSKTFKRDASAPAISVTTKISEVSNLTITLQDNMSGLSGYAITTSTEKPSSWTSISGKSYSKTVTKITGTYYVYAKDVAGNTTYKSVYVQELKSPTCSISLSGSVGDNDWYDGDVTVKMTTSGTATTKGLATTKNSTNGKTSVVHSSDGKSITYYGYVRDKAGNVGKCSINVKKDTTKPSISYTLRKVNGTVDVGPAYSDQWSNYEIRRNITANDSGSGLQKVQYRNEGDANWYDETYYNGNYYSFGEGTNNAYFRAIDIAGNVSDEIHIIMKVDWTPPAVWCGFNTYDNTWEHWGSCNSSDWVSGVSTYYTDGATYYYVRPGANCMYNGPFTTRVHSSWNDGTYAGFDFGFWCGGGSTVNFECPGICDNAGNCSAWYHCGDYSW